MDFNNFISNPSWVEAISTGVSLIIAVIAVIFSAVFSYKNIKLTRELAEEQARPYIVVYINAISKSSHKCIKIKNFGKTAAIIKEISFDPLLKTIHGFDVFSSHIGKPIAPNQAFTCMFPFKRTIDKYNCYIEYLDSKGKIYSDEFLVDFVFSSDVTTIDTPLDPKESLEIISRYIQEINKNML